MEERWTEGGTWTGDSWTGLLDVRALHSAAGRKKELRRSEQANHEETKLLNGRGCWTTESWTGLLDGRELDRGESWIGLLLDRRELADHSMELLAGRKRDEQGCWTGESQLRT